MSQTYCPKCRLYWDGPKCGKCGATLDTSYRSPIIAYAADCMAGLHRNEHTERINTRDGHEVLRQIKEQTMRDKGFKPYDIATIAVPVSKRRRYVEVISMPTPEGTIMVRMVPGEPATMVEVKVEDLERCGSFGRHVYVHIAKVNTSIGTFPEDMLRYDSAFLFDHTQDEETAGKCGVMVWTLSSSKKQSPWTTERWASFCSAIFPVLVRNLKTGEVAS